MKAPIGATHKFIGEVLNNPTSECVIWPYAKDRQGYARYNIEGKVVFAHRYLCEIVNGRPPTPSHHAAHSCGNGAKGCVNPKHVSWKTPKENNADKVSHGTVCFGAHHGRSKLTERDVREILDRSSCFTLAELADAYGVSFQHVSRIIRGEKWKHLTNDIRR